MSEDIKYPIYRKYKNEKEFMKLNSNGNLIIVKQSPFRNTDLSFAIVHSDNPLITRDFFQIGVSVESNRDEFEKAYGRAQYLLTKANIEQ